MIRVILLLASLSLLTACPLTGQRKSEVSKIQRHKVPYSLPKLTSLGKTEATQTKGSVTVAVSTATFKIKKKTCKKYKQLPATWVTNNQYPYEVTYVPYVEVAPSKLVFRVKVVNNLNQVMRLAGVLVRFQIDGKEVTLKDPGPSTASPAMCSRRASRKSLSWRGRASMPSPSRPMWR